VIGVDFWMDADRMNEYYALSLGFEHFGPVFAGAPDTSVWQSAPAIGWSGSAQLTPRRLERRSARDAGVRR